MAGYLNRVAAAGARVSFHAQPSPAAPPVLPGSVAGASVDDPPIFQYPNDDAGPSQTTSPLPSAVPAADVFGKVAGFKPPDSIQASVPLKRYLPTAAILSATPRDVAPQKTISELIEKKSALNDEVRGLQSSVAPRSNLSPAHGLGLPVEVQPATIAPTSPTSVTAVFNAQERIPRIVTRRQENIAPVSATASRAAPLNPEKPVPIIARAAEDSSDRSERIPERETNSLPSTGNNAMVPIRISPPRTAPAFPSANHRHAEPEARVTIGRVDVLVTNELPPRPSAPAANFAIVSGGGTLRSHFQDRFILQR